MSLVVDASIVFRLLANVKGDDLLRRRLARKVHAPALIDVEIASVVRGHVITSKPEVRISEARGRVMLERYAQLRIVRHPMLPLQPRVLELRNNLTAYDGMYVALAELLGMPLLTDDAKFAGATGHRAEIHRYPPPLP
ncbi:type II toxin-antitoxin system VapC family toxin [Streptosporangium sp. NBC_01810]|uniref:type II toxin-antitoxin system VapC family toxin n=1 Tax=Streptosporangium sp. NBC_01810 TaxID=2975951 RepID=UPI002DD8CC6F|nr:type II toxin-antitoxin system VapC family toxin [Streptosporangium sp. NBC_01810]WSA28349.1 type II toxin-antitoxin system VapC family toxin [Streptosporangium sp. NBC_01810]